MSSETITPIKLKAGDIEAEVVDLLYGEVKKTRLRVNVKRPNIVNTLSVQCIRVYTKNSDRYEIVESVDVILEGGIVIKVRKGRIPKRVQEALKIKFTPRTLLRKSVS